MIAVLHTDHTDAIDPSHINRLCHTHMGCNKSESIMSIDLGHDRRDLAQCRLCCCVKYTTSDAGHVRWNAIDSMSVHTSQVGGYEASSHDIGVLEWDPVALEDSYNIAVGVCWEDRVVLWRGCIIALDRHGHASQMYTVGWGRGVGVVHLRVHMTVYLYLMPLSQDSVDAATCLLAPHDNLNEYTVDQVRYVVDVSMD